MELTEDQKARILANRNAALERRRAIACANFDAAAAASATASGLDTAATAAAASVSEEPDFAVPLGVVPEEEMVAVASDSDCELVQDSLDKAAIVQTPAAMMKRKSCELVTDLDDDAMRRKVERVNAPLWYARGCQSLDETFEWPQRACERMESFCVAQGISSSMTANLVAGGLQEVCSWGLSPCYSVPIVCAHCDT